MSGHKYNCQCEACTLMKTVIIEEQLKERRHWTDAAEAIGFDTNQGVTEWRKFRKPYLKDTS